MTLLRAKYMLNSVDRRLAVDLLKKHNGTERIDFPLHLPLSYELLGNYA